MYRSLSIVSALSVFAVIGVAAQDFGCVNKFIDDSRNVFGTFGCNDASDGVCLCQNDNFKYSIRDSAIASCSVSEEQVMTYLSETFCLGVSLDGESETQVPTTAATTSEAPTTAPTSEPAAETPTTVESTSTEPITSDRPSETSSAPEQAVSSSSTTSSFSETSEAATATETSDVDSDEAEEDDDEEAVAAGGLSQGAAVGIGVGVAVVFIAIAAVVIVILMRNRKRKQQKKHDRNLDISRPMPGPGRALGSVDHNSFEKRGMDSIEMVSNRYEDMLPRQTPRTMV